VLINNPISPVPGRAAGSTTVRRSAAIPKTAGSTKTRRRDEWSPALFRALNDRNENVRKTAARALEQMQARRASRTA